MDDDDDDKSSFEENKVSFMCYIFSHIGRNVVFVNKLMFAKNSRISFQ